MAWTTLNNGALTVGDGAVFNGTVDNSADGGLLTVFALASGVASGPDAARPCAARHARHLLWRGIDQAKSRPAAARMDDCERFITARREAAGYRSATASARGRPHVEVPRSSYPHSMAEFFASAQAGLETALLAERPHCGMGFRHRLWMSITGSSSGDA